MAGTVNEGRAGWTELRVHGVSGTLPEQMLQHSQVEAVAGDANAAFFRRRFESPLVSADTGRSRVEAHSWGALTAGAGQRAPWLLLTPFMLVNVAFCALPAPPSPDGLRPVDGGRPGLARTLAEAVMRLFALSITVTFMLVAVQVAMDLVGWQCVRPGGRDCSADRSWLSFLTWTWLDEPGRRLAVTALVPLVAVALLGWLGRTTWLRLERTSVPKADPAVARQTPLENRQMWNGSEPARRLRAVHLTAALAVVGVFLSTPLTAVTAYGVLVLQGLLLVVTVVVVCRPATVRRPPLGTPPRKTTIDAYAVLPWIAGALVTAGIVQEAITGQGGLRDNPSLPALLPAIQWLVIVQLALLLVMAVLLALLNRASTIEAPVCAAWRAPV